MKVVGVVVRHKVPSMDYGKTIKNLVALLQSSFPLFPNEDEVKAKQQFIEWIVQKKEGC
jgi:hypothetical protein